MTRVKVYGGVLTVVGTILVVLIINSNVHKDRFRSETYLNYIASQIAIYAENNNAYFPDELQWEKLYDATLAESKVTYIPGYGRNGPYYNTAIVAWLEHEGEVFFITPKLFCYYKASMFKYAKGELPDFYKRTDDNSSLWKLTKIMHSLEKSTSDTTIENLTGQTLLLLLLMFKENDIALYLIEDEHKINAADPNGITPLMRAVSNQNEVAVGALLVKGANKEPRNIFGDTALDIAKRTKNKTIIKLLE